jgi:hypothetical protein
MDKLLAMAIFGSGTAHIFGPGMNPPPNILKKNDKEEEHIKKTSSLNGEIGIEKKQRSSHVIAFAPIFDGIYFFETMVLQ